MRHIDDSPSPRQVVPLVEEVLEAYGVPASVGAVTTRAQREEAVLRTAATGSPRRAAARRPRPAAVSA